MLFIELLFALALLFWMIESDQYDSLREELDKIDPELLKKEIVSHWHYDPEDSYVLHQINREYFTLVIYLKKLNEQERQKLEAFLDKLDQKKYLKGWFLDVIIFTQHPKKELFDLHDNNDHFPELSLSAYRSLYPYENFRAQLNSLRTNDLSLLIEKFIAKILFTSAIEINSMPFLHKISLQHPIVVYYVGPRTSEFLFFLDFQSLFPKYYYGFSFDKKMFINIQKHYQIPVFKSFEQAHVCVIKGQVDIEYNHSGIRCYSHFFIEERRGELIRAIKANHIKHEKDMNFFRKVIKPIHEIQFFVLIMPKQHQEKEFIEAYKNVAFSASNELVFCLFSPGSQELIEFLNLLQLPYIDPKEEQLFYLFKGKNKGSNIVKFQETLVSTNLINFVKRNLEVFIKHKDKKTKHSHMFSDEL